MTIDYTNRDYDALRGAMLELARERLPDWDDHSPNDLGVLLVELFAHMGDTLMYYLDRVANESYLDTAVERRSIVKLLRLIGYELRPPTPASADLTLLFAEDAPGVVTVPRGTVFQSSAKTTGEPITFHYVRPDLEIDLSRQTEPVQHEGKPYLRFRGTLPVLQVDAAIVSEIAGSSDGTAGQRYPLARSPLIEEELEVTVDEGSGPVIWQRRPSLLHSLASDQHFTVRRDENSIAYIEFGDDRTGAIPQRGRNNIRASYRVGGGIKGNVAPSTITKAVSVVPGLAVLFNEDPATGGAGAESSSEAAKRGPQLFRSMDRAVTAADYEAHAKTFGVGKARARAPSWNRIELFVAPRGGGQPTDTLKDDLRRYFADRRIMTSILAIRDPQYVSVCIEGAVEIDAFHITEQVQQEVARAISDLFAFEAVGFAARIYLSKIYEALEGVAGVVGAHVLRLSRSGATEALPARGVLDLDWSEIPLVRSLIWAPEAVDGRWGWSTPC